MLHDEEALRRDTRVFQRRGQLARRFIEQLVSMPKGTPVHGHGVTRIDLAHGAQGLFRIHMHYAHEPARFIGTDRQRGQINATEALADIGQILGVTEIAAEKEPQARLLDNPGTPERLVGVPGRARAPVLDRNQCESDTHVIRALPPVEFGHGAYTLCRKPVFQTQRHEEHGLPPLLPIQTLHRLPVKVIVVTVGNNHRVGMRQRIEAERGLNLTFRSGKRQRRCTPGQMRVGQHVDTADLQQKRRVPDPGQRWVGAIGCEKIDIGLEQGEAVATRRILRQLAGPAPPLPFPEALFRRMRVIVAKSTLGVVRFRRIIMRVAATGCDEQKGTGGAQNNGRSDFHGLNKVASRQCSGRIRPMQKSMQHTAPA